MKSVLISIRPKWCEKIASGEKTIEVRKSRPKLETPFKCYIYCTKDNTDRVPSRIWWKADKTGFQHILNGKVIGEFVCDRIYQYASYFFRSGPLEGTDISTEDMTRLSCLTAKELYEYEHSAEPKENCINLIGLYGWHISELKIYDKPKELSEFYKNGTLSNDEFVERLYDGRQTYAEYLFTRALRKPPQSWCYVKGGEG